MNDEIILDKKVSGANAKPLGMNPLKFALWLFIVSFVMFFAAMSSAYIVKRTDGNWLEFELPSLFYVNSVVLLISSISMQFAFLSAKRNNFSNMRVGLIITIVLGLAFLFGQLKAWGQLIEIKAFLVGNPAGSFIYLLSGSHGAHLIGGLIFLLIVLFMDFKADKNSKSMLWIELCTTFWHFLDGLWVYLFLFLILNR